MSEKLEWANAPEKAEFILTDESGCVAPSFVYDDGDRYREVGVDSWLMKSDYKADRDWKLEPRP